MHRIGGQGWSWWIHKGKGGHSYSAPTAKALTQGRGYLPSLQYCTFNPVFSQAGKHCYLTPHHKCSGRGWQGKRLVLEDEDWKKWGAKSTQAKFS